jgi:hypothetical protein
MFSQQLELHSRDIEALEATTKATVERLKATIERLEATVEGLEATVEGLEATNRQQAHINEDLVDKLDTATLAATGVCASGPLCSYTVLTLFLCRIRMQSTKFASRCY